MVSVPQKTGYMNYNCCSARERSRERGCFSPCSCWRHWSRRLPWAAAPPSPGETGGWASSSRCPGSQTASSRRSSDPPWRPAPPPAGHTGHKNLRKIFFNRCVFCFPPPPYQRSHSGRHWSATGGHRARSNALDELLQRQRHQLLVLLRLHHVPAQVRQDYIASDRTG